MFFAKDKGPTWQTVILFMYTGFWKYCGRKQEALLCIVICHESHNPTIHVYEGRLLQQNSKELWPKSV